MPKFLVDVIGNVRYTAHIILEAASESDAEDLALRVMPSISKETCSDEDDITDTEVNEVSPVAEDAEEPDTLYHTIHYAEKIGRETFFVISWNCRNDEFRLCVGVGPNSSNPDGYFTEKGTFKELEDAHESFQAFVNRAKKQATANK